MRERSVVIQPTRIDKLITYMVQIVDRFATSDEIFSSLITNLHHKRLEQTTIIITTRNFRQKQMPKVYAA
jgi:hypothetical protein